MDDQLAEIEAANEQQRLAQREALDRYLHNLAEIIGNGHVQELAQRILQAGNFTSIAAYPAGDRQAYQAPINESGQIIPSREGMISGIDRKNGMVMVTHADGTTSSYQGMQQISGSLEIGQTVDRHTQLGQADPNQFLYQRFRDTDGGRELVAPGRDFQMLAVDYNLNYGHPPSQLSGEAQQAVVQESAKVKQWEEAQKQQAQGDPEHPYAQLGGVDEIRSRQQLTSAEASADLVNPLNVRNETQPQRDGNIRS